MSDLRDFVEQAAVEMRKEYERIRSRACEDPGTAGDEGEGNWAELLRRWLPAHYHVRTKGRILGSSGEASRQLDVVVLFPEYPPGLLEKKIYLAGGVAAVFECKLTLRRKHLTTTIQRAAEFQEKFGLRLGTPRTEMFGPISYGLLAHSHEWKRPGSDPAESIENALWEEDERHVDHPRKMLDIVCVADLGTWTAHKSPVLVEPKPHEHREALASSGFMERSARMEARHAAINGGAGFDTTALAIGEFLTAQLSRLAFEDTRLQRVAWALRNGQFSRAGQGRLRSWELNIFSKEIRDRLLQPPEPGLTVWNDWSRYWA